MAMMSCLSCGEMTLAACRCDHCDAKLMSCGPGRSVAAALLGLSLTGCIFVGQPKYGVPDTGYFDGDGDGFAPLDGDCDDSDANIHPDADETPGDGVDSNCDGEDDT